MTEAARAAEAEKRQRAEAQRAEEAEKNRRLQKERAEDAEKRAKEQKAAASKLRRLAWMLALVALAAAAAAIFGFWQKGEAVKAERTANEQKIEAEKQKQVAVAATLDAQAKEKDAVAAKIEADEQKQRAVSLLEEAARSDRLVGPGKFPARGGCRSTGVPGPGEPLRAKILTPGGSRNICRALAADSALKGHFPRPHQRGYERGL